jgi:hypothetical protein
LAAQSLEDMHMVGSPMHWPFTQSCPLGQSCAVMQPVVMPGTHWPFTHCSPAAQSFWVLHPVGLVTHWPLTQLWPAMQSAADMQPAVPGAQKPNWQCRPIGHSLSVVHIPPPPDGMQKPKRHEVPVGQVWPFEQDWMGGMHEPSLPQHFPLMQAKVGGQSAPDGPQPAGGVTQVMPKQH